MILSFTKQFPWGEPTNFERQIDDGTKKHTFRQGARWRPDSLIHFWMGSPRNPGRSHPFNPKAPFLYSADPKTGNNVPIVLATENWEMEFINTDSAKNTKTGKVTWLEFEFHLRIGWLSSSAYAVAEKSGYQLFEKAASFISPDLAFLELVAKNDGFGGNPENFVRWFHLAALKNSKTILDGKLVHWFGTCKVYDRRSAEYSTRFRKT